MFDSLSSFFGRDISAAIEPPSNLSSTFSSLFDAPDDGAAKSWLNDEKAKSLAIGLFEETRNENKAIDPIKFTVREWITDKFRDLANDIAAKVLTGRSLDEKTEEYRREKAVWDAAFERVGNPLSLAAFSKQIEAFNNFFDLWDEK